MEYILYTCLFFCILNLILNFFIGLFLVRSQRDAINYLNTIQNLLDYTPPSLPSEEKIKAKTWDQKYEEELSSIAERIAKNNRGLTDPE